MRLSSRTKILLLFFGDIAALYAALVAALLIRYGAAAFAEQFVRFHVLPFTLIFPVWLLVFFVAGLYDLPRLRNNIDFAKTLFLTLGVNALLTIAIFYFIPYFTIAPKTNLFLFIAVLALIEIWWRRTFNVRAAFREGLNRVLLLGESPAAAEIIRALKANPQIGYEIAVWLKRGLTDPEMQAPHAIVRRHGVNLVVIPQEVKHNPHLTRIFYELLASGVEVRDLPGFYELVFQKVPTKSIKEVWFLEHRLGERRFYDDLKRSVEFLAALFLFIGLSPFLALLTLIIRLASPGKAIYRQTRIGRGGKAFILYKFRTMEAQAEQGGPRWAEKGDRRVTPFGRFLRHTHLDELPQLMNIVKGELSFVGPRPERPEFVMLLSGTVPYYATRHLIKPGVTGWAQVNYRYGASVEDAHEKLQYDLYYIKNRSIVLDLAIILKTLKSFFVNHS